MQVHIHTKTDVQIECHDLNGETVIHGLIFDLAPGWHRITIPLSRKDLIKIEIGGADLKYFINSGQKTEKGFEIWLNGNIEEVFDRVSECIAQDDLLRFKDISKKYMHTVSWNEKVEGDFVPEHIKKFFAKGDGPFWFMESDYAKLPYIEYDGDPLPEIDADKDLDEDLQFIDEKFTGQGKCKSWKKNPGLPTMKVEEIKNKNLRMAMQQVGFVEVLQMTYVELDPKSVIPIHRDDCTYFTGKYIIDGPSQLWLRISGEHKKVKFKFKNAGMIDVSKPVFINNKDFVHSLVHSGDQPRGVLLVTGISTLTNKHLIK